MKTLLLVLCSVSLWGQVVPLSEATYGNKTRDKINKNFATVKNLPISIMAPPYNAVCDGVTNDSAAINSALSSGALIVTGNPNATCKISTAITVPAGVTLRDATLLLGTAGMNGILINSRTRLEHIKITGTGTVSIVERGVYPAADGILDFYIDAEVTNLTVGVQIAPLVSVVPSRGVLKLWVHDIVGTPGVSEGYGVLLSPANYIVGTILAKNVARHALYLSAGASYNDFYISADNVGNTTNAAAISIYALSTQSPNTNNRVRGSVINVPANSDGINLTVNTKRNDISLMIDGTLGQNAIRVEGDSTGSPLEDNIHDCVITGTWSSDAVLIQNADGTKFTNNDLTGLTATSPAPALAVRKSGTYTTSLTGPIIRGNVIKNGSGYLAVLLGDLGVQSYYDQNKIIGTYSYTDLYDAAIEGSTNTKWLRTGNYSNGSVEHLSYAQLVNYPASDGLQMYCSNCNSTCTTGASTGQFCVHLNGAWTH